MPLIQEAALSFILWLFVEQNWLCDDTNFTAELIKKLNAVHFFYVQAFNMQTYF